MVDYNRDSINPFKFDFVFRDDVILKVTIKRKKSGSNNRYDSITICDSYPILTSSLSKLCKDFNVSIHKGNFPYSFVNENTLFYKGITPDYYHYSDQLSPEEYEKYVTETWDFKEESIKYLELDIISLYSVLKTANYSLWFNYKVNLTDGITISGLANKIFRINHYDNEVIPLIDNKKIYEDIKNAYYGGCTEVYKPYGENLNYYDVNSLYPYTALNDMPGCNCDYIEYYSTRPDLKELLIKIYIYILLR